MKSLTSDHYKVLAADGIDYDGHREGFMAEAEFLGWSVATLKSHVDYLLSTGHLKPIPDWVKPETE